MKKIILCGVFAIFAMSVFGQKTIKERSIETATKALVEKYNLTKDQEAKTYKIQTRYFKNLDVIKSLETTDEQKYLQKMAANSRRTRTSLRMILDKEQIKILAKEEYELRKKRAEIAQTMQKTGASKLEIQKAMLPFE